MVDQPKPLLEIRDLVVEFRVQDRQVQAVRGANLTVYPGQTVAIVGESGSGKSTTAAAVMGLLQGTGTVVTGTVLSGIVAVGDGVTVSPSKSHSASRCRLTTLYSTRRMLVKPRLKGRRRARGNWPPSK